MKDYKEVAADVFRRSEQIIADNRRRKKRIISAAVCICVFALVGFGAWQSAAAGQNEVMPQTTEIYAIQDIATEPEIPETQETTTPMNWSYICLPDNDSAELIEMTMMISSYGDASSACYAAPENGTFNFSVPLRDAMDEYGDGVLYQVFVDMFADKESLEANSPQVEAERQRLADLGYVVAYETYYDNGVAENYYFTLHAKMDQLTSFTPSEEYGYMFFLYDERVN